MTSWPFFLEDSKSNSFLIWLQRWVPFRVRALLFNTVLVEPLQFQFLLLLPFWVKICFANAYELKWSVGQDYCAIVWVYVQADSSLCHCQQSEIELTAQFCLNSTAEGEDLPGGTGRPDSSTTEFTPGHIQRKKINYYSLTKCMYCKQVSCL